MLWRRLWGERPVIRLNRRDNSEWFVSVGESEMPINEAIRMMTCRFVN